MPATAQVMTSPSRRNTGGSRATPTPAGVPVRITVPGSSVRSDERNSTSAGTAKTISEVEESCITSPFSVAVSRRSEGSRSVAMHGPRGQKLSKLLARTHCRPRRCQSRAETSLPTVYPRITPPASAAGTLRQAAPMTTASSTS